MLKSTLVAATMILALAVAVVPVSADILSIHFGVGVGDSGCLAGDTTAGTGPVTLTQDCSFFSVGGPHTATAAASADYGKLGAALDLTLLPIALLTSGNEGGVTADFQADYVFSGPGPTVTTSLNLDLDGTLNAVICGGGCSIDVGVMITSVGLFDVGLVGIENGSIFTSNSNLDITGVLLTGSIDITTHAFTVPTGTPTNIFVQLFTDGLLQSSGTGISSRVTSDFLSTLSFNTNGPVFNLPSGSTVNGPGVVDNRFVGAAAVPAPSTVVLLAAGVVGLLVTRCRRWR